MPNPQESGYRDNILSYLASVQAKAVEMTEQNKLGAARVLTEKNLKAADAALKAYPNDPNFHSLMGYTLKDLYQSSKNLLPPGQRQEYLGRARKSFEQALRLDPNNAAANNGMGNVLFFEGHFDEAIKKHDTAIKLMDGNYPAAEHDKRLVLKVKSGEVP